MHSFEQLMPEYSLLPSCVGWVLKFVSLLNAQKTCENSSRGNKICYEKRRDLGND